MPVGQNQPLTVTFVPTDSADYATANAEVLINVAKATPLITWTGPNTDMTYGQALSSAQLNATATVNGVTIPGTFVYTPGIGTVPPTGANFPLSVTFTPTDTTDYATVTVGQNVDVDPATPVITWNNPADIIDGTPLSSTQLDATANVPGVVCLHARRRDRLARGSEPVAGRLLHPDRQHRLQHGRAHRPTINVDLRSSGETGVHPAADRHFQRNVHRSRVTVAVEDSAGTTLPGDDSTVTLTLSSGTFVGGGTTVTAQAVNGVATFRQLGDRE